MLIIEDLRKSFGGVHAMNGVSLKFDTGSLTAVIGPNGAGKTTFFNLITGDFRPDSGRVVLGGEDIAGLAAPEIVRRGIGRAFQIASIFPTLTVREAIFGRSTRIAAGTRNWPGVFRSQRHARRPMK